MNWPWEALGLPGPAELSVIRQAYAERLKRTRPDENPESFQRLRNAYQAACRLARQGEGDRTHEARREREKGETKPGNQGNARWDFERLFAEGEAEERGRRFQKLWKLRRENQSRYDAWRAQTLDGAALDWMAVSHALSLMEELAGSRAEAALWSAFCKSGLFAHVKRCPDFVFALEDFLKEWPEIPQSAYNALFRAYGFDRFPVGQAYRPLYEALKAKIPEALLTRPPMRAAVMWRTLSGMLALILIVSALNLCADFLAEEDRRAQQVRKWLIEDFGSDFICAEQWRWSASVALLDTETETYFYAAWDGPRDMERDKKGYVTNYAEARMSREIAAFADQWNYTLFPRYEPGNAKAARETWRLSYLQIPLTGAGEGIIALGDMLSAVKKENWYEKSPPDCHLFLGWQNWSFYEYDAQAGRFDGPALRDYYEGFFGADLCRIALRGTGVAREDMGKSFLLLPEIGVAKVENHDFFHVIGIENPAGRPLYHYFLSGNGAELFCVPGYRKISELTLQDLYCMDGKEYEVKGFSEPLRVFHAAPDET